MGDIMTTEKAITLREHLSFETYNIKTDSNDPGNEDISFLLKVIKLIPKRAEKLNDVDPRLLATYTLSAYEEATEKYAKAYMWYSMKKISLEATLGRLIVTSTKAATIAEKAAKSEDEFKTASELVALADAYVKFLAGLLKNFEAAHYWAREREKREQGGKNMSGYQPHTINQKGEVENDDLSAPSADVNFG
jgi:hypothetical protein